MLRGGLFLAFLLVSEYQFQILFHTPSLSLFFMHDMYMMNKEEKGDALELYRFLLCCFDWTKTTIFFIAVFT